MDLEFCLLFGSRRPYLLIRSKHSYLFSDFFKIERNPQGQSTLAATSSAWFCFSSNWTKFEFFGHLHPMGCVVIYFLSLKRSDIFDNFLFSHCSVNHWLLFPESIIWTLGPQCAHMWKYTFIFITIFILILIWM